MTSNIKVKRICQQCGKEFIAKKTTTKTCSDNCAKVLYKARKRNEKINLTHKETTVMKTILVDDLRTKEFLTVKDVSKLLNCSVRTAYYLIDKGTIKAVNIAERKTLVKRSEIDKLFD